MAEKPNTASSLALDFLPQVQSLKFTKSSCGLMDKAPPSSGGDCGFESRLEYFSKSMLLWVQLLRNWILKEKALAAMVGKRVSST